MSEEDELNLVNIEDDDEQTLTVEEPMLALMPLPTNVRPISPPLQEPRKDDSSDTDDEEIRKRIAILDEFMHLTQPPRRPPSEALGDSRPSRVAEDVITKRFNLDRPKSPITIAPTFNKPEFRKEPFQEGVRAGMYLKDQENSIKMQQMQQQIQFLQNENLKGQRQLLNLQSYNALLQGTVNKLQNENALFKDYINKHKKQ